MRSLLSALLLSLSFTALAQDPAAQAPAPPQTYAVDGGKSVLVVKVYKDPSTLAAGLSHDHAVRAVGPRGSITWDSANPAACKIDVTVAVSSLDPDDAAMRKLAGLAGELDAGQREEIKAHIMEAAQLDAAKYPNITFKSTSCAANGSKVNVSGNLNVHGKDKAITVPMTLTQDAAGLRLQGSFSANHSDFGMKPFEALFGQLKNQNKLDFMIDLKAK